MESSSQTLKQRLRSDDVDHHDHDHDHDHDHAAAAAIKPNQRDSSSSSQAMKTAMAKRGLRSLAVAVSLPLSLTLLNIYLFGSGRGYGAKPFRFPPLWLLHIACMASSLLMGVSGWLVWAKGGFHDRPTALSLYLAQLGLSLAWDPIVLWLRASWLGLVVCAAVFGALLGCLRDFKLVNPIAADLVKPCLLWAAFLAFVNLMLLFL